MTKSRSARVLPLAVAAALVACSVDVVPADVSKRGAPARGNAVRAPAKAEKSAGPGLAASPSGSPATGDLAPAADALPGRLLAPAGASVVLRGRVQIDGSYAVSSGAAVLSNNGGSVLSDYGAGLVARFGAEVLANNGGNLIANNGAGIIANNGGGVISDYGIGVVANNGAGLISDKGGAIVANNGGGMIGKTKFYGLTQALGVPGAAEPGALRPAAGLVVGVASLRRSSLLALGQDAQGEPAYAVYTDEAGGYAVHVPVEEAGNVLVLVRVPPVASAPGTVDPRLAYDLVTPLAAERAAEVDEDSALATRYLMSAYVNRLRTLLTTDDPDGLIAQMTGNWVGATPELRALVVQVLRDLRAVAEEVGLNRAPRADAERVARQVVNSMLARIALASITVSKQTHTKWVWPEEDALSALTTSLRHLRIQASAALARDARYFDSQAYLMEANAARAAKGLAPWQIKKGADLGDFVVREYLLQEQIQPTYDIGSVVFQSVDALVEPVTGVNQVDRLAAASSAVIATMGTMLVLDQEGARTEAIAIIRAYRPTDSAPNQAP